MNLIGLSDIENFYLNGHFSFSFKESVLLSELIEILRKIHKKEIKEGFTLEEKYGDALDLRPNTIEYSSCFLNILKENDITEKINVLTGKDLVCTHVQVRTSNSRGRYIRLHRDSYRYKSKIVGNFPPVYKLIFYPIVGEKACPSMLIKKNSHRKNLDVPAILDFFLSYFKKSEVFQTSNTSSFFFNTELFHAPAKESKDGSVRLIYTFCSKYHMHNFKTELNDRTVNAYRAL